MNIVKIKHVNNYTRLNGHIGHIIPIFHHQLQEIGTISPSFDSLTSFVCMKGIVTQTSTLIHSYISVDGVLLDIIMCKAAYFYFTQNLPYADMNNVKPV